MNDTSKVRRLDAFDVSFARRFLTNLDIRCGNSTLCRTFKDDLMNNTNNTELGHGHVHRRPDGFKARCGGPDICNQCKAELAADYRRFRPVPDLKMYALDAALLPERQLLRLVPTWGTGNALTIADGYELYDWLGRALPKPDGPEVIPWQKFQKQAGEDGVEALSYINSLNAHVENQRRAIRHQNDKAMMMRQVLALAAESLERSASECRVCNFGDGATGAVPGGGECPDCGPLRQLATMARRMLT